MPVSRCLSCMKQFLQLVKMRSIHDQLVDDLKEVGCCIKLSMLKSLRNDFMSVCFVVTFKSPKQIILS